MNEPAAERSREKLFDDGEKDESFFAGAIGHFSQCVEKKRSVKCWPIGRKSMNVLMK